MKIWCGNSIFQLLNVKCVPFFIWQIWPNIRQLSRTSGSYRMFGNSQISGFLGRRYLAEGLAEQLAEGSAGEKSVLTLHFRLSLGLDSISTNFMQFQNLFQTGFKPESPTPKFNAKFSELSPISFIQPCKLILCSLHHIT